MKNAVGNFCLIFLLACLAVLPGAGAMAQTPDKDAYAEARKLFVSGKAEEAWLKLEPHLEDRAGEIEFDYLLARSALMTNRFQEAIEALNRILILDPAFVGARIELARAYYGQGLKRYSRSALEQARAGFLNVLALNPPESLHPVINEYLVSIEAHLAKQKLLKTAYAEAGAGYDTNATSGPVSNSFSYQDPAGTPLMVISSRVAPITRAKNALFYDVNAGAGITFPMRRRNLDMFLFVDGTGRAYNKYGYSNIIDLKYLNYSGLSLKSGFRHYGKSNRKTLTINPHGTEVDSDHYMIRYYQEGFSMDLLWEQFLSSRNMLTFRFNGGESRMENRDKNAPNPLWLMSVDGGRFSTGWVVLHDGDAQARTEAQLMVGHDGKPRCWDCMETPYVRDVAGLSLSHARKVGARARAYVDAVIERSDYKHKFFTLNRRDFRGEMAFGGDYAMTENMMLKPKLHLIYQDSSVTLFDFRRAVFSLSTRWTY